MRCSMQKQRVCQLEFPHLNADHIFIIISSISGKIKWKSQIFIFSPFSECNGLALHDWIFYSNTYFVVDESQWLGRDQHLIRLNAHLNLFPDDNSWKIMLRFLIKMPFQKFSQDEMWTEGFYSKRKHRMNLNKLHVRQFWGYNTHGKMKNKLIKHFIKQ